MMDQQLKKMMLMICETGTLFLGFDMLCTGFGCFSFCCRKSLNLGLVFQDDLKILSAGKLVFFFCFDCVMFLFRRYFIHFYGYVFVSWIFYSFLQTGLRRNIIGNLDHLGD